MRCTTLISTFAAALMGCLVVLTTSERSGAADISWNYSPDALLERLTIYISGTIEPGDLKKIAQIHSQYELLESDPCRYQLIDEDEFKEWQRRIKKDHEAHDEQYRRCREKMSPPKPFKVAINLHSTGGNLEEAMQIGRWVRQKRYRVMVSIPSVCASACVFILAAGVQRGAYGKIVIHRPYFTQSPSGDVSKHLRSVLFSVRDYFSEMNIPENLADEMFSIRPEDGIVLSPDALSRYRLNKVDIAYEEERDLQRAKQLGISRAELIRRRQTYEHALKLGACPEARTESEFSKWIKCDHDLMRMHGLVKP